MRLFPAITLSSSYLGLRNGATQSNARKSLLGATLGIALSLVPLVSVMVVADGMIEAISLRLIELSSSHIRVNEYYGTSGIRDDFQGLGQLASSITERFSGNGITGAWAERQGNAIIIGKSGRKGSAVRAVDPSWFTDNAGFKALVEVKTGTMELTSPRDAILGEKIAGSLGLEVGDAFRIMTLRSLPNGQSIPRFSSFTLKATISSGYQEIDGLWVFIPLESGLNILDNASSSTFLNLRTDNPFSGIDAVRNAVTRFIPEGFTVFTWQELNRAQFQSFNTTRILLLFIMFLIVLVASVNVSSALVMLVLERRAEIAILKSVGIHPSTITWSFLLTGLLCGIGGIVIGLPLGILCAIHINGIFSIIEQVLNASVLLWSRLVGFAEGYASPIKLLDPEYYLEFIPVRLSFPQLYFVASATMLLSAIVSLLPAIRAGREKPIDTLRKY